MDVEQRARDALNEVHRDLRNTTPYIESDTREKFASIEAVCRLIEQHDAKMREVSDAAAKARDLIEGYVGNTDDAGKQAASFLSRFILPDPVDPLVEAISAAIGHHITPGAPWDNVRAELAKRGLTITKEPS